MTVTSESLSRQQRDYSKEMDDLYAEHTQRKKELIEKQKQDLEQLRDQQDKTENQLRSHNEAVINHIRKSHQEEKDNLLDYNERELKNLTNQGKRNYESLRQNQSLSQKSLEEHLRKAEESGKEQLKSLEDKDENRREALQQKNQNFFEDYNKKINELQQKKNEELSKAIKEGQVLRNQTTQKFKTEIEKLEGDYKKERSDVEASRRKALGEANEALTRELTLRREKDGETLKKVGQENANNLLMIKQKSNDQIQREENLGKNHLEQIRKINEAEIARLQRQKETTHQAIIDETHRDLENVFTSGEKHKTELQAKQEREISAIQEAHKKNLEREKERTNASLKELDRSYTAKFNTTSQVYQKNLQRQKEDFDSIYSKNAMDHRNQMANQEDLLNRELIQTQKDMIQKVDYYSSRKEDPFYTMIDRQTQFLETPKSYILKTYVPSHEKNNVQVQVHDDKAVISGARYFKDKVQTDDKKVATNTYQTFREEFPFPVRVASDAIIKEQQGDFLIVTAPKIFVGSR